MRSKAAPGDSLVYPLEGCVVNCLRIDFAPRGSQVPRAEIALAVQVFRNGPRGIASVGPRSFVLHAAIATAFGKLLVLAARRDLGGCGAGNRLLAGDAFT